MSWPTVTSVNPFARSPSMIFGSACTVFVLSVCMTMIDPRRAASAALTTARGRMPLQSRGSMSHMITARIPATRAACRKLAS